MSATKPANTTTFGGLDMSQGSIAAAERRASERVETDEAATIQFPNGNTRLPCRIVNRSEGGVLLKVGASARLPNEFILLSGSPETRNVCRIAWRIGSQAGCEFLKELPDQAHNGQWIMPVGPERCEKVINSRLLKRPLIIS